MPLLSPANTLRALINTIAISLLAMVLLGAGMFFNWPPIILNISFLAYFLSQYPVAIYLHWRICNLEALSKVHMLLYILNPILAWIALFFTRKAAQKAAGA